MRAGSGEARLLAGHRGLALPEEVVADGAPFALVVDLKPSLLMRVRGASPESQVAVAGGMGGRGQEDGNSGRHQAARKAAAKPGHGPSRKIGTRFPAFDSRLFPDSGAYDSLSPDLVRRGCVLDGLVPVIGASSATTSAHQHAAPPKTRTTVLTGSAPAAAMRVQKVC